MEWIMSVESTTPVQAVADEATARAALRVVRDDLVAAVDHVMASTDAMRDKLVAVRPLGLLTVDEMAQAIGRDRNYVDRVWSAYGTTTKGRQTRVPVVSDEDAAVKARDTFDELADMATRHNRTLSAVATARSARDRMVAMVYAAKVLGPSAIATEVGIDRNHVLRIARKAGVAPVHRTGAKNQYTRPQPAEAEATDAPTGA
jgi:hypothetical protein